MEAGLGPGFPYMNGIVMRTSKLSYKIGQFLMFAGPAALLFCMVVIIPFFYGLYLTFTSWDGVSLEKPFVGLDNYAAVIADTDYWHALLLTFVYSVITVIITNVLAFLLAFLVTSGIKGQNFFRAGFFVPNLIGGIVLGYVWKFIFNRAFVSVASAAAGSTVPSLLSTPTGALFCLIFVSVWQYAGYMMLIYIAGFMSVDASLKEAALIDMKIALITLKYTQSNSVCYVKDGQAIGIGAGQQSRIHCTRLAGNKADNWFLRQSPQVLSLQFREGLGRADRDNAIDVYMSDDYMDVLADGIWENTFAVKPPVFTREERQEWLKNLSGVTLGSDAFFPFSDNIDRARRSGVKYVVQPGGSVRDDAVIDACNRYGMAMVFTGIRLFHH